MNKQRENKMSNENSKNKNGLENKKRKNLANSCKKQVELSENKQNNDNTRHYSLLEETNRLLAKAYESELIIYIKTLLEAYKSIPNIINIIDRIIENKASTIPAHNIYGNSYLATYNDMTKMIDMSSRKDKLLNLYVIIEKMLNSLDATDRKIAVLKFVQNYSTEEITEALKTCERTIFRRANRIIEKLALYCLEQNWTTEFIKFQIGKEPWINELYSKKKEEGRANKNRGERNLAN